jgi:hypothetical protein
MIGKVNSPVLGIIGYSDDHKMGGPYDYLERQQMRDGACLPPEIETAFPPTASKSEKPQEESK